jgi:choline dehydrogenase-like flavoprotein
VLERAANVTVYLHANAVDLVPIESGRGLSHVQGATLEGRRFTVRAQRFVLATGAIENARLLLASGGTAARGLGNDHDLVGRFFMEHLSFPAGLLVPTNETLSFKLYNEHRPMQGGRGTGQAFLTLPETVLRRERLLNVRAWLPPARDLEALRGTSEGVESVFGLIGGLGDDHTGERLAEIASHLDEIAVYGYRRFLRPAELHAHWLYFHMEQPPNRDSRVTLGTERDELGLPRVRLDWEIGDAAKDAFHRTVRLIAEELGRSGIGRVKMVATDPETGWPTTDRGLRGAWHQMGTTRMHSDPSLGVVDADCRVHGIDNLYIAGSSVFPTTGYTNPTLTIVALALRMADQLKTALA